MNVSDLLNGLLVGSLFGLVGMGLSLLAGVVRLINLAQGDFLVGGAYLGIALATILHWDPLFLMPLVAAGAFLFGYLVQRFLLNPALKGDALSPLVMTFGLSLILEAGYQDIWGASTRSLQAPWGDSGVTVLGVRLQMAYLIAFAVGLLLTGLTLFILNHTRLGSIARAAAADPATARLMGIDVERVFAVTLGASAALAAVAGVITGVAQSVSPTSGLSILLFGFAVMAIAGVGNIAGAFIAGLGIGVLQAVSVDVLGSGTQQLGIYVAFLIILVVKPTGGFRPRGAHA
jgi:branched-chain amino acid transport system permease protein